mgnify:CR=1 FL=1
MKTPRNESGADKLSPERSAICWKYSIHSTMASPPASRIDEVIETIMAARNVASPTSKITSGAATTRTSVG